MNYRLLLVEDDPVTCAFLASASRDLGCRVDTAATLAQAEALATCNDYALLLIDANLPDGSGVDLLQRLRQAGKRTPALAHTASNEPRDAQRLREADFLEVLAKPITASAWQAALRQALEAGAPASAGDAPGRGCAIAALPVWDDAKAAAALGGNPAHVRALRTLFLQELPAQRDAIRLGDASARTQQLHRLLASCGFVGAARMAAAVAALHAAPDCELALQDFLACAECTLATPPEADA